MMRHHPRTLSLKFQLNRLNGLDTRRDVFAVIYILLWNLIMETITSHIFINIFQTVPFTAVKFTRGIEKKIEISSNTKISHKVWKKNLKQSDRAPFKVCLRMRGRAPVQTIVTIPGTILAPINVYTPHTYIFIIWLAKMGSHDMYHFYHFPNNTISRALVY